MIFKFDRFLKQITTKWPSASFSLFVPWNASKSQWLLDEIDKQKERIKSKCQ